MQGTKACVDSRRGSALSPVWNPGFGGTHPVLCESPHLPDGGPRSRTGHSEGAGPSRAGYLPRAQAALTDLNPGFPTFWVDKLFESFCLSFLLHKIGTVTDLSPGGNIWCLQSQGPNTSCDDHYARRAPPAHTLGAGAALDILGSAHTRVHTLACTHQRAPPAPDKALLGPS